MEEEERLRRIADDEANSRYKQFKSFHDEHLLTMKDSEEKLVARMQMLDQLKKNAKLEDAPLESKEYGAPVETLSMENAVGHVFCKIR
eukprot:GFYU01027291.1.p1 GENE.GFYU01027291.1~~GFYU01027291.1.p1  ORF type:complete len:102 (+),score=48.15 GFYU01027291.1:43-306(+)